MIKVRYFSNAGKVNTNILGSFRLELFTTSICPDQKSQNNTVEVELTPSVKECFNFF
jgi:hypothetical protein